MSEQAELNLRTVQPGKIITLQRRSGADQCAWRCLVLEPSNGPHMAKIRFLATSTLLPTESAKLPEPMAQRPLEGQEAYLEGAVDLDYRRPRPISALRFDRIEVGWSVSWYLVMADGATRQVLTQAPVDWLRVE